MSPTRVLILSVALLLPELARAQNYECNGTIGTNCRTIINDGGYRSQVATTGTTTSTVLVLPGACPQQDRIVDVDLKVHLLHPYIGDLEVLLSHPDGTSVSVLYRPGVTVIDQYCPNDDLEVTFDDDDGVSSVGTCASTIPALRDSVLPFNPLETFDGKPRNGQWTLTMRDYLSGNEGVLAGWTLELPCVPDLPDVSVDTTDQVVAERGSDNRAVVTFGRGGSIDKALEVEYVVTGSASLADFVPLPGKITIAAGSASAELEIRAVEDNVAELDETIIITLLPTSRYEIGGRGSAYVTLTDSSGQGGGSGRGGSGGSGGSGGGASGRGGAGGNTGGSGDEGDAGPDAGDDKDEDDGCNCRVAGAGSRRPPAIPLVLATLVLGFAWRRRQRR